MASLTLRTVVGRRLTNAEVDANFSNLNDDTALRLLKSGDTMTGRLSIYTPIERTPLVLRCADASASTSLSLRNNQDNWLRALQLTYFGSGAVSGEEGRVVTTGGYPLSLGTNNVPRVKILSSGDAYFSNAIRVRGWVGSSANLDGGEAAEVGFSAGSAQFGGYDRVGFEYKPAALFGSTIKLQTSAYDRLLVASDGAATFGGIVRANGWWESSVPPGNQLAAEIGVYSGTAYFSGYNRVTSSYAPVVVSGYNVDLQASGESYLTAGPGVVTAKTTLVVSNVDSYSLAETQLRNDQNSASRALALRYLGSLNAGGESGVVGTTGYYPLRFITNNVTRLTITELGAVISSGPATFASMWAKDGDAGFALLLTGDATTTGSLSFVAKNNNTQGTIGLSTTTGAAGTGTIHFEMGKADFSDDIDVGGDLGVVGNATLHGGRQVVVAGENLATLPVGSLLAGSRSGSGTAVETGSTLAFDASNYVTNLSFAGTFTDVKYGTWRALGVLNGDYGLWVRVS